MQQQQLASEAALAEVMLDEGSADPGDFDDAPTSSTQGSDSGNEGSDTEGDSGTDDDHDAQPGSKPQQHASFLEGEKSASFAKAFAKIMGSKSAKTDGRNVILAESASLAKRKAEVATEEAAAKAAKKQRQERKQRGHVAIPVRGVDPAADACERQLQKLATRGVVLLFNAVNKAQKQRKEAEAAGSKASAQAAKAARTGIFAELNKARVVSKDAAAAAARSQQPSKQQHGHSVTGGGSGWEVFGEGFPGLTGGVKMKDWDKAADSDDEARALAGSDVSDESDGAGGEAW